MVDEAGVLVLTRRRGAQELLRVPLSGGDPEILVGGPRTVSAARGRRAGPWSRSSPTGPARGEVVAVGPDGERTLTSFGAEIAAARRCGRWRS